MSVEYNTQEFGSSTGILAFPDHYVAVAQMLPKDSSLATTVGTKKIVKAGTFFPSNGASTVGIILNDVDVTYGDRQAALLIHGFIKKEALPVAPDGSIPAAVLARLIMLPVTGAVPSGAVTYDDNDADSGSAPTDATSYEFGDVVTILGNTGSMAESGKAFAGWATSATATVANYQPGDVIPFAGAITLYAVWKTAYNVTYNGNTPTSGTAPTDSVEYLPGALITVKANTDLAKTSKAFVGWAVSSSATAAQYVAGNIITMASADITLYAVWVTSYNITYDAGSGSGTVPTDATEYAPGVSAIVKNKGAIVDPANYVFIGWNTASDGSGTMYQPGQALVIGAADVTLYAQFSAVV